MLQTLLTQANLLAYLDGFRFFALVSLAGLVGSLMFKRIKTTKAPASAGVH
jgi:hypothetical protein